MTPDETNRLTCPHCGEPVEYGIEYPGIYDGVLVWRGTCGHQWPRFEPGTRLGDLGAQHTQGDDT